LDWKIEIKKSVAKEIKKLKKEVQKRIVNFLKKLEKCKNPRSHGKLLRGKKSELWRYRVGDYRIICKIEDKNVTILVLLIGHRKDIYR